MNDTKTGNEVAETPNVPIEITHEQVAGLIDSNEQYILEQFDSLTEGGSVVSDVQNTIIRIGNEFRLALGLSEIEIGGLECAGFTGEVDEDSGQNSNPIIASYLDANVPTETVVGYTLETTSGKFVVDISGMKTAIIAFCQKK